MPYESESYGDDGEWELVTDEEAGGQRWVNEDGDQFETNTGLGGIFTDGLGSQFAEEDEWDLDDDEGYED